MFLTLPPLERTQRESPALATIIISDRTRAITAVLPEVGPGKSEWEPCKDENMNKKNTAIEGHQIKDEESLIN